MALSSITHWALHHSSWSSNKRRKGETARGTEQHHFHSCMLPPNTKLGYKQLAKPGHVTTQCYGHGAELEALCRRHTRAKRSAHGVMDLGSPHCHIQPRKQGSFSRSPGEVLHAAQPHTQPQLPIIQPISSCLCSGCECLWAAVVWPPQYKKDIEVLKRV